MRDILTKSFVVHVEKEHFCSTKAWCEVYGAISKQRVEMHEGGGLEAEKNILKYILYFACHRKVLLQSQIH